MYDDFVARAGPAVSSADDEYWRLVTRGFLHAGLIHLGFNMYFLYWLGTMLEPALGHVRFLGAVLRLAALGLVRRAAADAPTRSTVGASGAVFGLMARRVHHAAGARRSTRGDSGSGP